MNSPLKTLMLDKLLTLSRLQEKHARSARARQLPELALEHRAAAGTLKSIMREIQQRPADEAIPFVLRQAELTAGARWVAGDLRLLALYIKTWTQRAA